VSNVILNGTAQTERRQMRGEREIQPNDQEGNQHFEMNSIHYEQNYQKFKGKAPRLDI
jgi:hypothetical protein